MIANPSYDAVAFGAHPDDIEMAMAGTVAALCAAGHRVAIVNLTGGEMGTYGDADTRRREAERAAAVLGCELRILDEPDGGVVADRPTRERIAGLIRQMRPRIVFAPYPHARAGHLDGRTNVDHLATGLIVRDACKLARLTRALPNGEPHNVDRVYYTMLPDDVPPSYVVDVSAHEKTLTDAILAYESQMPIERGSRSILEMLLVLRRAVGMRLHVELGEAFLSEDTLGGPAEYLLRL